MAFTVETLDTDQWLRAFQANAARKRIPIKAHLELTSRCNLRCQHCYLGDQLEQHRRRRLERDTAAVMRSLEEWAAAGCLQLVITGGDPMMRRDFKEVYRHAVGLGMFVTVFCDGILVSDAIVDLFREYPPRSVEVSIYGATAETYEKVTQVPGSHAAAWSGIRRLLDTGVKVALKTVLLTLNEHELGQMAAQAEAVGCAFRFDAAIFPCLPGHAEEDPLVLRVAPEVAVKWDLAIPGNLEKWVQKIEDNRKHPVSDSVYSCGAGATAFYADPYGVLSPCLLTTHYQYKAAGRSFDEIWETDLAEIRAKKRTRSESHLTGDLRGACTHCPAMNYLETGDEELDSDYMKETVALRYDRIMAALQEGKAI
jgi:MoaA/NifB/PqqE/SkfB family radical SAM enzyme